jgi:hypothetical protein
MTNDGDTFTVVEEKFVDLRPTAEPDENAKAETKPEAKEEPKEEKETLTAVDDKAKETKEAVEAVVEQQEQKKDETPAWMKAEVTKERNRRRAAEERIAALEEQNRQTLALAEKYIPKAQTPDTAEPQREAYDDPDKYWEAVTDWKAEQKHKAYLQHEQEQTRQQAAQKVRESHDERMAEAENKYPGISDVAKDPTLPINEWMAAALMQSEAGPDILHYLDQNRDKAKEIYGMNPARAAAEIGKIEASLNAPKEPRVSKAVKPISPVGSNNGLQKDKYDPSLSSAEWAAQEDAERAAKVASMRGIVH